MHIYAGHVRWPLPTRRNYPGLELSEFMAKEIDEFLLLALRHAGSKLPKRLQIVLKVECHVYPTRRKRDRASKCA